LGVLRVCRGGPLSLDVAMKNKSKTRQSKGIRAAGRSQPFGSSPIESRAMVCAEDGANRFPDEARDCLDEYLEKLIANEQAFLNAGHSGIDVRAIMRKCSMLPDAVEELSEREVLRYLRFAVDMLARHHLCLSSTNHLSDRDLLAFIVDKVLPEPVPIGPHPQGTLIYHDCCPGDTVEWYSYYADEFERDEFESLWDEPVPEQKSLVSDRDKWIELLAESYRDEALPTFEE
jgi:hypothetical protein